MVYASICLQSSLIYCYLLKGITKLSVMEVSSDRIIYEHPLNEKARTLLRLEHLFLQTEYHLPLPDTWNSRAAIDSLLDMVNIFSRADIKADLIKELERQRSTLSKIRHTENVNLQRLGEILDELERIGERLHDMNGQIGKSLRTNEFLKNIMQRSSIPGGTCAFDLPSYHYWLMKPAEYRHNELNEWLQTLEPVQSAIMLILSLVRGSTNPTKEVAHGGLYQHNLDAQAPVQLVRVGVPLETKLFTEISGGKHRFTIRFMIPSEDDRPVPTSDDVTFYLNCCFI